MGDYLNLSELSGSDEEDISVEPTEVEKPDDDQHNSESEIHETPSEIVAYLTNPQNNLTLPKERFPKWSSDDLLQLARRIENQAEKIVWNDIAFDDHSANDCSCMWPALQQLVHEHRGLKKVLCEAKQVPSDNPSKMLERKQKNRHQEHPKRPNSAYMIFLSDKKEEIRQNNPTMKNSEQIKLMGQMWHKLTNDDREIYIEKEKELKKVYDEQLKEFYIKFPEEFKLKMGLLPNKPLTPFQLYFESEIITRAVDFSKSETILKRQCNEKWKNMSDEEKVVFINLAIANEREFKKQNVNDDKSKFKTVLSKEELLLSDKLVGKPKKPPISAYNLFATLELQKDEIKKTKARERMPIVGKRWNNCPQEIKARLISEVSELQAKYNLDYEAYLKSLPEEQQQEETKSKKRKLSEKASEVLKKKKTEKSVEYNLEKPEPPELLVQSHSDKNVNVEKTWDDLSKKEKKKYEKIANQVKKEWFSNCSKNDRYGIFSSSSRDSYHSSSPSADNSKNGIMPIITNDESQ